MSKLEDVENGALFDTVIELFKAEKLDPSVEEILAAHFKDEDGTNFDDETIEDMRGRLPGLRGLLAAANYKAVLLSLSYYRPIGRSDFVPSIGQVVPPSFRDVPPVTDAEARQCLAGNGARTGRAYGLRWITSQADDRIYQAFRERDMASAASRVRGSTERLIEDYQAGGLSDLQVARLLQMFDNQSRPEQAEEIARLRGEMPKLLNDAAE
jgi:hypothetical protein